VPTTESFDRRWRVLAVLCCSVFLVVVDNTIVNVALPSLSRNLHTTTTGLQWIVDGYSLPFAGLLLAGGGVSDRLGRRRVMQVGLLFFGICSAFAAWSSSTGELIAARVLMGVAAAFIFPASLSIVTTTFDDPRERAKAFGFWGATSGAAVAFGPLVGGLLLAHLWYGSIFLVNVPIVVVTIALVALTVPESKSPARYPLDLPGLVLGSGGVTGLVLAIIEGPAWGWGSVTTLALFAVATVFVVGFARYELGRTGPLLDVRVFTVRDFSAGAGSIATAFFCLFGFIFLMTQYFQLVRGYSALSAGVHTLPFAAVAMVVTPLGALLALRVGGRTVISAGLGLMAAALVWIGFLGAEAPYVGPVVGSMVLLAVGFSLINAPATAAVMGSLRADQIGAGSAVNNTTRELGGTMGVAIVGSVFTSIFAPAVVRSFSGTHVSGTTLAVAKSSMQAALATASRLATPVRPQVMEGVTNAFLSGFHRGCFVAGAVGLLVAGVVAVVMPSRAANESLVTAPTLAVPVLGTPPAERVGAGAFG
jgi:EmrB/QacA subfamily drug resistance transporter